MFPYSLKGTGKGGEDPFIEEAQLIFYRPPPPAKGKGKGKGKGKAIVDVVQISDEEEVDVVEISDDDE